MKIWLDDQINDPNTPNRHTPEGFIGISNPSEFKDVVRSAYEEDTFIEVIDFDNDLGVAEEGYDLLKWLKDEFPEIILNGCELRVHSANPEGRENMEALIEFCNNKKDELREYSKRLREGSIPSYEDLLDSPI